MRRRTVHVPQAAGREEAGEGEQALFLRVRKEALGIALLFRHLGNEFVVVKRDTQFFADGMADMAAGAAERPADVDDGMHNSNLTSKDSRIVPVLEFA